MKRAIIETIANFDETEDVNFPKLVTFASGDQVPDDARLAGFRSSADGSLLLTADTDRLSYVNKAPPEQLMLAMVSKSTGRARLVPLQHFHLAPALESEAHPKAEDAPRPTWLDVGRAFGLAAWQKRHQRVKRLAVASGSGSVAQSLQAAAEHLRQTGQAEGDEQAVATAEDLVPPRDTDADQPAGVYSRQHVLPDWLAVKVLNSADQFEEALSRHASTSQYLAGQAARWREADEDRFTLTMYAFYLVRLLRYLQDMHIIKSWRKLLVPPAVLAHLRDTFMERSHNGWDRSERLIDKLVCYFMVVTLWIHDYTIDLNDIASATRINIKKLSQYAGVLGLTVSGLKATLKLPLRLKAVSNSRRIRKVAAM